ncbi:hypothetical protein M413DRAFT_22039 [Hebeloma cylindrosporum]|uniref:Uncharacterized protein n=1 Tax=Hebeloma cylindrosporum TaxID=76867 RepID=A0A0C2XTU6_HEBCY|nr:hypothetical protein M413DRAFT_28154 [Hebeloma cylindrosporum h7]KIM49930.1 hypothetical protein M413DRAFT_22039 [Hebeloma cylindrosporum h7]
MLFSTLTDHFQELSAWDDVGQGGSLLVDDNDDLRDIFAGEDDMGVTAFAGKTFEELSALLDFPEGHPPNILIRRARWLQPKPHRRFGPNP